MTIVMTVVRIIREVADMRIGSGWAHMIFSVLINLVIIIHFHFT